MQGQVLGADVRPHRTSRRSAICQGLIVFTASSASWLVWRRFGGQRAIDKLDAKSRRIILGETKSVDLGTIVIRPGAEDLSVAIQNPFDQTITMSRVETSCNCLETTVSPTTLEPHAVGELRFRPRASGPFDDRPKRISFHTSERGVIELLVACTAIKEHRFEPTEMSFGGRRPGEHCTAKALLFLPRPWNAPFPNIVVEASPAPQLRVQSIQRTATTEAQDVAVDQYELVIALNVGNSDGDQRGRIVVRHDSTNLYVGYPVLWTVRQPLEAYPRTVGFVGRSSAKRRVFLYSDDLAFRVLKAHCDHDWIAVEVDSPASAKTHEIHLQSRETPLAKAGHLLKTTLRMEFDHPSRRSIETPITWLP